MIAVDAGVDFVQGFYFQVPSLYLDKVVTSAADFDGLLNDYKLQAKQKDDPSVSIAGFFEPLFKSATALLSQNAPVREACRVLLEHHAVSRCYLIGPDGVQLGETLLSESLADNLDPRFRPLENASSADWFRQHYLQRALTEPGHLQITRPYLSVSGAHMCVTLSCSYTDTQSAKVLCCDIFSS